MSANYSDAFQTHIHNDAKIPKLITVDRPECQPKSHCFAGTYVFTPNGYYISTTIHGHEMVRRLRGHTLPQTHAQNAVELAQ